MPNQYLGEIRIFAGNFAPFGWAFCDGSILPISGNDNLAALLQNTYGGDGVNTFALPNLQSRVPIHQGSDGAGNTYALGQSGGLESVTLSASQIPTHSHALTGSTNLGDRSSPSNNVLAQSGSLQMFAQQSPNVTLGSTAISAAGGSQPHTNLQPYVAINYIIAITGIYPT